MIVGGEPDVDQPRGSSSASVSRVWSTDVKIYVGNLSFDSTESEVQDLFSQHGEVEDVAIITDRDTGRSRGFGFVEMKNDDAARAAIDAINGQEFGGRTLTVNEARPRNDRRGGGGGGGGRGRGGW